ncbi:uncharacterized protein LOC119321366 [Triticum dicoccoides]|uniref:uncharacterized protein LOC119321366 n=1 Tax=Triticum dicoccoides TaxID=85692 RepID=UPI001891616C|nr:uncharacterized protein LOC119321366 [Triticum dicoccoides]
MQDHQLESALIVRYEQNMSKLTDFYRQRAKKNFATKGDRNTNFFHHAVLKRRKKNTIVSIKDENDNIHFNPQAIANTFVSYFRYIFASPNVNVGRPFLASRIISNSHDYTYSIPDKEEILNTLKDMKINASPGPDGFNVEFYIATWSWIGDDVTTMFRKLPKWLISSTTSVPNQEPTASAIIATPVVLDDSRDILCWKPTPSGKSTKTGEPINQRYFATGSN